MKRHKKRRHKNGRKSCKFYICCTLPPPSPQTMGWRRARDYCSSIYRPGGPYRTAVKVIKAFVVEFLICRLPSPSSLVVSRAFARLRFWAERGALCMPRKKEGDPLFHPTHHATSHAHTHTHSEKIHFFHFLFVCVCA